MISFAMQAPVDSDHHYKLLDMACALLDPEEAANLSIAITEAISNVKSHSGATQFRLAIDILEDRIEAMVIDDGKGWTPDPSISKRNAEERLKALSEALTRGRGYLMMIACCTRVTVRNTRIDFLIERS